ncbi:hypothetical protein pb186bvf_004837 [Paramecium bursaria]
MADLEKIGQEVIMPQLVDFTQKLQNILQAQEQTCFNESKDADIFVKCMLKNKKKVQKGQNTFDLQALFLRNQIVSCIESKQSQANCSDLAKKGIESYISQYLKRVN